MISIIMQCVCVNTLYMSTSIVVVTIVVVVVAHGANYYYIIIFIISCDGWMASGAYISHSLAMDTYIYMDIISLYCDEVPSTTIILIIYMNNIIYMSTNIKILNVGIYARCVTCN